jgi:hypothetical protein
MRKRIVRLASTMLVTGGLGFAGIGLPPATAQAQPGVVPLDHGWCPPWVPCGWRPDWQPDWQPQWGWQGQWWQGDQGDNQQ